MKIYIKGRNKVHVKNLKFKLTLVDFSFFASQVLRFNVKSCFLTNSPSVFHGNNWNIILISVLIIYLKSKYLIFI